MKSVYNKNYSFILMAHFKIFLVIFILISCPAYAVNIKVINGDTLYLGDQKIRLAGLDATKLKQKCKHNDNTNALACELDIAQSNWFGFA